MLAYRATDASVSVNVFAVSRLMASARSFTSSEEPQHLKKPVLRPVNAVPGC